MDERIMDIRERALKSIDPDEVARIMDEVSPWSYPHMVLHELMMHLRATLYRNLVNMFIGDELSFDKDSVKRVDEITDMLGEYLDEKYNILPQLPENIMNMLTWMATLEGKMDIYDSKLSKRIINRYMDYAGGYLMDVYIKAYGFEWVPCEDGDVRYILKKGDVEVGDPSVSVYKQLIDKEDHKISVIFEKFVERIEAL